MGTFYVRAVPTELNAELVKKIDFVPQDTIRLTVNLLDQANEKMPGISTVTILDPDNNEIDRKTVALGTEGSFILPEFAVAGLWIV